MDALRWITVVLSMILGFGITRLLSAGVAVFRSRDRATLDWIPLTWSACIFLWQLQFWWAMIELERMIAEWTVHHFLVLVLLDLVLFVAAALILPPSEINEGDSLADSFERDGRWALIFISAYFIGAALTNWLLWRVSPFSYPTCLDLVLALPPLLFLTVASRKGRAFVTVSFAVLSLWAAWEVSPHKY